MSKSLIKEYANKTKELMLTVSTVLDFIFDATNTFQVVLRFSAQLHWGICLFSDKFDLPDLWLTQTFHMGSHRAET